MKKIISNIGLILALSIVVIMVIGILLYDYIPTGTTISKVKVYESDDETTKVLSNIAKESQTLSVKGSDDSSVSSGKSNVVLQTYSITKSDLDVYQSADIYERGKVDPFKKVESQNQNDSSTNVSTTSGTTNNNISSNNSSMQNTVTNSSTTNNSNTNNVNNTVNPNITNNVNNSTSESGSNTNNNTSKEIEPNVSDGTLFNSTTTK